MIGRRKTLPANANTNANLELTRQNVRVTVTSRASRARVEHVYAVVKRMWGFSKVRYPGLDKNANRSFVVSGLANLYLTFADLIPT